MLFLNVLCRKNGRLHQALKMAAVQICLPAVLLHTLAVTQYGLMDVVIPVLMFLTCVVAWALSKALGRALAWPACSFRF